MPSLTKYDNIRAIQKLGVKCDYNFSHKNNAMFHCHFHEDWTPSMSINFVKGIYNCFQCGKSGSISKLIYEETNQTIESYLGIIQDLDSLNLPSELDSYKDYIRANASSRTFGEKIPPLDIRGIVSPFFKESRALAYLRRRGIPEAVAKRMEIGYSKEIRFNGTLFIDRVLIPIYDADRIMINIEGRAVEKSDPTKCLYPKGATKPLYEYYKLDINESLYVFEGIVKMAVARSDPFFTNSTATLGSKISEYQLNQLKDFKNVVVVPDNDIAGEELVIKIKDNYKGNLSVLRISDSEIKDVDEIPSQTGMTVEEYRNNGGFVLDSFF